MGNTYHQARRMGSAQRNPSLLRARIPPPAGSLRRCCASLILKACRPTGRVNVMNTFLVALRTFLRIALPYFRSEQRWQACGLLAGVVGAELSVVYLAVLVNQWHGRFFNAVEARDWGGLQRELAIFLLLTGGAIATAMVQSYFGQMLLLRWRQ